MFYLRRLNPLIRVVQTLVCKPLQPEVQQTQSKKLHSWKYTLNHHTLRTPASRSNPRWLSTVQSTSPAVGVHNSFLTINIDSTKLELPYVWLRDHCRCDTCYNHSTNQKNILAQDLDFDMTPSQVTFTDDVLTLTWPDSHVTTYTLPFLQLNAYPGPGGEKVPPVLWDAMTLTANDIPHVDFEYMLKEENGLKELLSSLLKYGIGLVAGAPADIDGTQQAAERVSFVQKTMYGEMWGFTADASRQDTAYTTLALGAHNDSTYLSTPCGIQIFQCVFHDGEGGETLLVDGFKAAEDLRSTNPAAFETLCTTRLHHENHDSGHCHIRSLDPILKTHPITGAMEVIRYNQYDRCSINTVPPTQIRQVYESIAALGRLLQRKNCELWVKLKPGMVLFIDNWRVLHGRAAFTGSRQMNGCYLPHDDWVSKARQLGLVWK